jgi:hypothetical protein
MLLTRDLDRLNSNDWFGMQYFPTYFSAKLYGASIYALNLQIQIHNDLIISSFSKTLNHV